MENVFKSKTVPDEMLTFIIETFITKPFLYNGKILGTYTDHQSYYLSNDKKKQQ